MLLSDLGEQLASKIAPPLPHIFLLKVLLHTFLTEIHWGANYTPTSLTTTLVLSIQLIISLFFFTKFSPRIYFMF